MTIEIRPVSGFADLERWVAVRNDAIPDDPENVVMMALVRASELEHVDLLAFEGDEVVGTGMLAGDPNSVQSQHPWTEVAVPPPCRGRGVGTALLRALSQQVRRLGKEGLQCEARAHDGASIGFLERRGFVEIGRLDQLELELDSIERIGADPPPGVRTVWLADRPDLIGGMYEVAVETSPELDVHIARQAATLHDWQLYELGDPSLLLDLSPVALAGHEVVGFATILALPEPDRALHRMVAVRPAWRGRGVTEALLATLISGARHAGYRTLLSWPRGDELPRLQLELGYSPRQASVAFRGPLIP